jgi:dTDP-4-dehydrorhamnose reductase
LAFKVGLLAEHSSQLSHQVSRQFKDLSIHVFELANLSSERFESEFEALYSSEKLSAVVSLGLDSSDDDFLSRLQVIVRCLEKYDTPLIHCGVYSSLVLPETTTIEEDLREGRFADSPIASVEQSVVTLPKHILLRSSWLIDFGENSLLATLLPLVLEQSHLQVSDRNFGCPVSTSQLVRNIVAVVQQVAVGAENWGSYHLRSADRCSEAEFADQLVRAIKSNYTNLDEAYELSIEDGVEAVFTGNADLSGRRLTDDFGIQLQTWRRGFNATLEEWVASREDYSKRLIKNQTSS